MVAGGGLITTFSHRAAFPTFHCPRALNSLTAKSMSSNGASRKHQASPLSLRFRKWTMQTASNVILALLVLHWVYMMCQIIHHDPPLPPPSLVQPLFPTNYTLYPPHRAYPFNFTWKWHPQNRSDRFPSVEERVKLYMSDWYVPACDEEDLFQYSPSSNGDNDKWPRVTIRKHNVSATLDSIVEPDMLFVADRETIADCARTFSQLQRQGTMHTEERIKKRTSMQSYCSEMVPLVDYIAGQESFVPKESRRLTPIISYFGDLVANYPSLDLQFPFIGKWRAAATKQQLDQVTSQSCIRGKRSRLETIKPLYNTTSPIIWKLEMGRHWDPLPFARGDDWHWEDKQLGALWRGDLTGLVHTSEYTDEQICFGNARCRFVFDHRHSKLIDAKLSSGLHLLKGDGNISGVPVIGDRVSMQRIQKYKVIISMEGNGA